MMRKGKAKGLVMQRRYRSQVVRDKTKYRRHSKHKKAPNHGGFFIVAVFGCRKQGTGNSRLWPAFAAP